VNYYPFAGYWLDIGRHDDYAKASEEFDRLKLEKLELHPVTLDTELS